MKRSGYLVTFAVLLAGSWLAGPAAAAQYCCTCRDNTQHQLDESNKAAAAAVCSLRCKRVTVPREGACEAPAARSAGATSILLYGSEDCSGQATRLDKSNPRVSGSFRSYQVEAGAAVTVWEKADYAGANTQPVVGSFCVSPGWGIAAVKVGQ